MAAKKKTLPFDEAEFLGSEEALAAFVTDALVEGDLKLVTYAIGVAARAKGMSHIAEATGLSREALYRTLSADGNPEFDTLNRVLGALGLQFRVEPVEVRPGPRYEKLPTRRKGKRVAA